MASSQKNFLFLTCLLAFLLFGTAVLAGQAPDQGFNAEAVFFGDCQVGNLNPPVGPPAPGIFEGDEAYAYHIFPSEQCDCTEDGFILESITQYLFFEDPQIPATFLVQGALLKADFDPSNNCYRPGPLLYESPELAFTIVDNGPVAIQVPTPGAPVEILADHYFLVLRYQGGAQAELVVDDDPQPCTEYVNRGSGWQDLFGRDKSGGGKVIVYGDIVCSPTAVGATRTTWDSIKSLYQ